MLLAGLLVSVVSAAPPRVEPCRQKFAITVETVEPVLGGERVIRIDSCGSGIQYSIDSERTQEAIAHVRVEKSDGTHVHLQIDNLRDEIVLERRDLPLDETVTLPFADGGRKIEARVLARRIGPPTESSVSIDAFEQPLRTVLRELQSATGWKIDGIDQLKDERATFRFDQITVRTLLVFASMSGGAELVSERDGEASFVQSQKDP